MSKKPTLKPASTQPKPAAEKPKDPPKPSKPPPDVHMVREGYEARSAKVKI